MASNPYFSLAALFFAALGFGLAPLGLAWLWAKVFSPPKPNTVKNAIYECGLEFKGRCLDAVPLGLLPVCHHFFDLRRGVGFSAALCGGVYRAGVAACVAMLVFVLLLIEGLAWAWAKGVLTWA